VADLILEGSFYSEELSDIQQLLIAQMKARTDIETIPLELTSEEFLHRIKLWPDRTKTSPSGIHLGYSKALLAPHDRKPDSPEGLAIEDSRIKLINWQIQLLNLALHNQYAFQRWQTFVNVMILKEQNNHKIHRLRIIHLYEHDYFLLLGLKWRYTHANLADTWT
jgi:hypothetical protein